MGEFQDVSALFKKVYGDLSNLLPEGYLVQEKIPFDKSAKIGDAFVISVVTSREGGMTLAGSTGEVVTLEAATAGAIQQASIKSSEIILPSNIPFSAISRTANAPASAFVKSTGLVVKNNLSSHQDIKEVIDLYGQSDYLLGAVSYATATYRGVSLTAGTGTINSITFTNGVNTTSKHILLAPGEFAAGIWVGRVGTPIKQLNAANTVVASGTVTAVNAQYGYIQVSFTPIAATSAGSHKLAFPGMESQKESVGIVKILQNTSSLFGIDASTTELWKGTTYAAAGGKLTFDMLESAQAAAVNMGLDGDLLVLCNPRSFKTLVTEQDAKRRYTSGGGSAKAGFDGLEFVGMAGNMNIMPHRYLKEGMCLGLHLKDWLRPGSSPVSMKSFMGDGELLHMIQDKTAYRFMSYSDTAIMCQAPSKSFLISGINDESAT